MMQHYNTFTINYYNYSVQRNKIKSLFVNQSRHNYKMNNCDIDDKYLNRTNI